MKRFLLFSGMVYYPSGGWGDFDDSFDSLEEAKTAALKTFDDDGCDWWQIVDCETMKTADASGPDWMFEK